VTDAAVLSTIAGQSAVVVGAGPMDRVRPPRSLQAPQAVKGRVLGLVLDLIPAKVTDRYYNCRDGMSLSHSTHSHHTQSARKGSHLAWVRFLTLNDLLLARAEPGRRTHSIQGCVAFDDGQSDRAKLMVTRH